MARLPLFVIFDLLDPDTLAGKLVHGRIGVAGMGWPPPHSKTSRLATAEGEGADLHQTLMNLPTCWQPAAIPTAKPTAVSGRHLES
jgi:hypothetical protein